LGFWIFDLGF